MSKKLIALLLVLCALLSTLAACGEIQNATEPQGTEAPVTPTTAPNGGEGGEVTEPEFIDYVAQLKLDMNSETPKQFVTVKTFIDGDTTHFNIPDDFFVGHTLKARYLAVNTPESTGKIQEWGKKASSFTKEALKNAQSIIVESDDDKWNPDSTGGRYLVWVWYKPQGETEYRNLNLELLQNGLSIASKAGDTRYGDICMKAILQAKSQKLHVHSNETDPDFYYGGAIPVTLKTLRTNLDFYHNTKVTFEATIAYEDGQTVYVEDYDAETDMYYGMTVYYGYNLTGTGLGILEPGNRVKFVGSVQFSEGWGWQISDIKYADMLPDDPDNIQLVSEGHEASNRVTTAAQFKTSMDVEVYASAEDGESEGGDEMVMKTFKYGELVTSTSITMENMLVESYYITDEDGNKGSASRGAFTLTCRDAQGNVFDVRTVVLRDANGELVDPSIYKGKTITAKGIVDQYNGKYQLKVFSQDDITIVR